MRTLLYEFVKMGNSNEWKGDILLGRLRAQCLESAGIAGLEHIRVADGTGQVWPRVTSD
jgi:hypothetical protein